MPSRFSYGPQGVIFNAAAAIGQGSAPDPSAGIRDYNLRLRQQADQERMQAGQLQLAQQQMMNRQTSTPSNTYGSQNPNLGSAVRLQKQLAASTILQQGDLDDDQQDLVNQSIENPGVGVGDFMRTITGAASATRQRKAAGIAEDKQAASEQAETESKHSKWQFAHSLIGTVTEPEVQQQFREMVDDPKTKLTDMQRAVTQYQATKRQTAQNEQNEQVKNIQAQLSAKRSEVEDAHKTLIDASTKKGIPFKSKDERNTKIEGLADAPDAAAVQGMAFDPNLGDPNSQVRAAFLAYRRARAEYSQLASQLAPQGQGAPAPQGQPQYQEGQVLHSPSTGRTFKIVNGQPMEIPNAGQ